MVCACVECHHSQFAILKNEETSNPLQVDVDDMELSRSKIWLINCTFLLSGIGINVGWSSIGFAMAFFMSNYQELPLIGNIAWTILVLCYNFPGFPVQIAQFIINLRKSKNQLNSKTKPNQTIPHTVAVLGLVLIAIFVVLVPMLVLAWIPKLVSFVLLMILALSIGFCQSCLFGLVFQLAGLFPSNKFSTIPCTMVGIGFSTLLLLGITIAETFDAATATLPDLFIYFVPLSVLPLLSAGVLATLRFNSISRVFLFGGEFPQGKGKDPTEIPLDDITCCCSNLSILESQCKSSLDPELESEPETKEEEQFLEEGYLLVIRKNVWGNIKFSCVSSFLIGASLVFFTGMIPIIQPSPNFGYFYTSLMYLQSISLFVGNELAAIRIFIKSSSVLIALVLVRLFMLAPLLLHGFYLEYDPYNVILFSLIANFCFSGSYLNSNSYVLASSHLDVGFKPLGMSLLNMFLYSGYLSGLCLSLVFILIVI
jgi:hypothetical protein